MRIMGVDPGLSSTGYAVIDDVGGRQSVVEGGVVRTKPAEPLEHRLHTIYQDIRTVIEQFAPAAMAIEDLHTRYRNLKTAIVMGHARGVVVMAAGEAGIPVFDYEPTRAKKLVTGSGRADKEQVQRAITSQLNLPSVSKNEHVADAFAIALCHAIIAGNPAYQAQQAAMGRR